MKTLMSYVMILLIITFSACTTNVPNKQAKEVTGVQSTGGDDGGLECAAKTILNNWAAEYPRPASLLNGLDFSGFEFGYSYTFGNGVNVNVDGGDYEGSIILSHLKTVDVANVAQFNWEFYMHLSYEIECGKLKVCYEGWRGHFPGFGSIDLPDQIHKVKDALPYGYNLNLGNDLSSLFGAPGEIFNKCVTFK